MLLAAREGQHCSWWWWCARGVPAGLPRPSGATTPPTRRPPPSNKGAYVRWISDRHTLFYQKTSQLLTTLCLAFSIPIHPKTRPFGRWFLLNKIAQGVFLFLKIKKKKNRKKYFFKMFFEISRKIFFFLLQTAALVW